MHHSLLEREECFRIYGLQENLRKYYKKFPFIIKPITISFMKKKQSYTYDDAVDIVENKEAYKNLGKSQKNKLINDMLLYCGVYGFPVSDYALYRFDTKNSDERLKYYTTVEMAYYMEKCRSEQSYAIMRNKSAVFELLRQFMGRAAFNLQNDSQLQDCVLFLKEHRDIIVKPVSDYGGNGIKHYIVDEGKELSTAKEILEYGDSIIEERVVQSQKMSYLNDSSVNTLRVCTFRGKNGIEIIHIALRVGRAGAIVDNVSSGGLFVDVDVNTHRIFPKSANGYDVFAHAVHPDSHKDLSGFEIPDWDDIMNIVKRAYDLLPDDIHIVGWDFAHTENGWIIIESNDCPGSNQEFRGGQAERIRALFAPFIDNNISE